MKTYSTVEVAARCAAACNKKIGDSFVRDCYIALYSLERRGAGYKWRLTEAQAGIIVKYAMEWHGSPNAPGITAWCNQHAYEIPGLRKALLPALTAPRPAGSEPDAVASDRAALTRLAQKVEQLEARIEHLQTAAAPPPRRQLTDGKVNYSLLRQRIKGIVVRWARDRTDCVDYETAWSDMYRGFWEHAGDPPAEWYENQLAGESKLAFFEQQGCLDLLEKDLPKILTALGRRYPINVTLQRELGL